MKMKEIMNAASSKASKSLAIVMAKTKKRSPEILLVSGIVGVITAAVMACKATTRVAEILDETKDDLETIHKAQNNKELAEKYSAEDGKKDLAIVYIQTGYKFVKLYGPSVALGVLSITGILASNNILRKRNMALAAAYAAIDKGFKDYRSRVIERFGSEVDKELRYNIRAKKIEEIVTGEDGKEKKVKKSVDIANPDVSSEYARFYDDGCTGWEKDAETNLITLRMMQAWANDKLKAQGFLFLNDVYRELGIPLTKAGQCVGWLYRPDDPDHLGDNYVDFGMYDINREKSRDFVNGYERSILLDFNVDGNILDYI